MSVDEIIASDFILGGEFGNEYGSVMNAYLKRIGPKRVQKLIRNEQNMIKLIKGRIDGYIGFLPVEDLLIQQQGFSDQIVMLPSFLINTGSIHIMLSKKNNSIEIFPGSIIARYANASVMPFYEVDEASKAPVDASSILG